MSGKGSSTAGRKRAHHDGGDVDGDDAPPVADGAEAITMELERKLTALFTTHVGEMRAGLQTHMGEAIRNLDSALQLGVQHVERRMLATEQRVESMEDKHSSLEERLKAMEQELAMVRHSEAIDPSVLDAAWERAPRLQMLRVNCTDMVELEELRKGFQSVLEAANIDEGVVDVQPIGQEPTNNFVIDFKGHRQTGARRVQATLDSLHQGRGEWKKVFAKSPSGQQAQVYLQVDKSQRKAKEETVLRRTAKILREMRPDWQVHQLKRENVISIGSTKLLRVVAPTRQEVRYEWIPTAFGEIGVDKQELLRKIEAADSRAAADVEWCP